eukprot:TRINITY_DN360_c0_g1_i1.p1 TRINITY_DN360_c0_g1~~TRINITY_DN360_c0_g1_i1.p1  ORF type:complete len:502 (-),score=172.33 TRINITY_DN360_c0_g1_i1:17-1459(-)
MLRPMRLEDIKGLEKMKEQGVQAEVASGIWNGIPVVVKFYANRTHQEMQRFQTEIQILQNLRHPNSVPYLGQFDSDQGFCVVMEKVDGGSLKNHIFGHTKDVFTRIKYARDVARVMWTVHSNYGILHRDLKLANILVTKEDVVKICDFGLSVQNEDWVQGRAGSPLYMAPEVMSNKTYSNKADVFSFAVILWELLHEREAFSQDHVNTVSRAVFYNHVCRGGRPVIDPAVQNAFTQQFGQNLWDRLIGLMFSCWDENPDNRLTFEQIFLQLQEIFAIMNIPEFQAARFWVEYTLDDAASIASFAEKINLFHQNVTMQPLPAPINIQPLIGFMEAQGFTDKQNALIPIKSFGRFITYYGPFCVDPALGIKPLIQRVLTIAELPWFHADITTSSEAERRLTNAFNTFGKHTFLVRISSNPGYFTISNYGIKANGSVGAQHRIITFNPNQNTEKIPFFDIHDINAFASYGEPCPKFNASPVYN